jgi:hypothetical protein
MEFFFFLFYALQDLNRLASQINTEFDHRNRVSINRE